MRRSLRVSAFLFFFYALTSFNSFFFFVHNILPKFALSIVRGFLEKAEIIGSKYFGHFLCPVTYEIQATAYLHPSNSTFSSVSRTV